MSRARCLSLIGSPSILSLEGYSMRRLFAGLMIATLCTSASLAETVTITIDNSYGKNLMRITVADGEVERTPVRYGEYLVKVTLPDGDCVSDVRIHYWDEPPKDVTSISFCHPVRLRIR